MFVGEARSLPKSGAPERFFTRVGSSLTQKHQAKLERLAKDKHPSLLWKSEKYGRKKSYSTGPRSDKLLVCFRLQDGLAYLNNPDGWSKSGLNLSEVNDPGDPDHLQHAVPVVGFAELVVTLVAPGIGPGTPATKKYS
jgi:hypothetical protein